MTTATQRLAEIGRRRAAGEAVGVASICSAHPMVIEAALHSLAISFSTASIPFSTTTPPPWTRDNLPRADSRQGRIARRLVDWFSGIRLGQFDRNERRSEQREFLVDAKSRQSRNGESVVNWRHRIAAASTRSPFTREGQRRTAI